MAVSTTNAYTGPLAANGATTTFPFTFSVLSGADLTVVLRDAYGAETAVSTNDYSVTLSGTAPSAGSVVFDTAPASGNDVWIYLAPDFTQETQFADGHPFIASAVNDVNDRAALRDQVLKRDIERALLVPIGEGAPLLPPAESRASKFLAFDSSGNLVAADGTANVSFSPAFFALVDYGWVVGEVDAAAANTAAFTTALDAVSAIGGGTLILPAGISYHNGLTIGDGTNSAQSTKHHNIKIIGAGIGSSDEVSNVQIQSPTVLRYAGSTSTSAACLRIAGPLHGIHLEGFELDCDDKAGIGLETIHLTDFVYRSVMVRKFTTNSYVFTTRTGFPSGTAYGCSNGSVYDCFAYLPTSNTASGILLTSGVNTATTLVGNPDTANVEFYGGVYFYGGSTSSSGLTIYGADNNAMYGSQLIPKGGNDGGGKSVTWTQWPGSTAFPLGNRLQSIGFSQGMSGTGGTLGNDVLIDLSDSGWTPNIVGVNFESADGRRWTNGQRIYRTYSIQSADLSGGAQNTTSTSFTDITGLSLSLNYPAGSKIRLSFSGLATKFASGSGDFQIYYSASGYGQSLTRVIANGDYNSVASGIVIDAPSAGTSVTAKMQFKSSNANQVILNNATFTAEVLY